MKAKGTWYIPTFTVDRSFFYIADTPNWQQNSFLVAALTDLLDGWIALRAAAA